MLIEEVRTAVRQAFDVAPIDDMISEENELPIEAGPNVTLANKQYHLESIIDTDGGKVSIDIMVTSIPGE